MEAGAYSLVETQWDTTSPVFCEFIKDITKKVDTYTNVDMASNRDEQFEIT